MAVEIPLTGIRGNRVRRSLEQIGSLIKSNEHAFKRIVIDEAVKDRVTPTVRSTQEIKIGGDCSARIYAVVETTRWALQENSLNLESAFYEPTLNTNLPYGTTLQNTDLPSLFLTDHPFIVTPAVPDTPPAATAEDIITSVMTKLYKWGVVSRSETLAETLSKVGQSIKEKRDSGEHNISIAIPLTEDVVITANMLGQETVAFSLGFTESSHKIRKESYPTHKETSTRTKPVRYLESSNITPEDLNDLKKLVLPEGRKTDLSRVVVYETQITQGWWPKEVDIKNVLTPKGWVHVEEEREAVLEELGLKFEAEAGLVNVFRSKDDSGPTGILLVTEKSSDKSGDKFVVRIHTSSAEANAASERLDVKILTRSYQIFTDKIEDAKSKLDTNDISPRHVLNIAFKDIGISDTSRLSRLLPYAYGCLKKVLGEKRQPLKEKIDNQINLFDPTSPPQFLQNFIWTSRELREDWSAWWSGTPENDGSLPELQIYVRGLKPNTEQTTATRDEIDRLLQIVSHHFN